MIRVGYVANPFSLPFSLALERGYFSAAGLEVEVDAVRERVGGVHCARRRFDRRRGQRPPSDASGGLGRHPPGLHHSARLRGGVRPPPHHLDGERQRCDLPRSRGQEDRCQRPRCDQRTSAPDLYARRRRRLRRRNACGDAVPGDGRRACEPAPSGRRRCPSPSRLSLPARVSPA